MKASNLERVGPRLRWIANRFGLQLAFSPELSGLLPSYALLPARMIPQLAPLVTVSNVLRVEAQANSYGRRTQNLANWTEDHRVLECLSASCAGVHRLCPTSTILGSNIHPKLGRADREMMGVTATEEVKSALKISPMLPHRAAVCECCKAAFDRRDNSSGEREVLPRACDTWLVCLKFALPPPGPNQELFSCCRSCVMQMQKPPAA